MKRFYFALTIISLFCVSASAQTNQIAPCPTISVTGPPGIPASNTLVTFNAEIGKEAEKLNTFFQWKVSNDEPIEGQGTNQIKVLWKDVCAEELTATVEVFGLPKNCQATASETAAVSCCFFLPIIVDEFSLSGTEIDKVRLDNLAKESQSQPTAQIYIFEKFAVKTSPKITERKNQKTLEYLKVQGLERSSITLLNAFDKVNLTQFILVPSGASAPSCDDCLTIQSN